MPANDSSTTTTEGARRFQCTGGACEYTCCAGWKIPVDAVHYDLLKARMEATASGRRAFAAAVLRRPGQDGESGASMRLLANGRCACLSPERLCHIQTTYGEALLPNACAQYPRALGIVGGQKEMWGSLSCPEMARQCLLADDGLQLVEIEVEPFSRLLERRALANPERPYDSQVDPVRTAALATLSLRQHPLSLRLYLLATLASRTAPFFHRDAARLEAARLEAELERPRTHEGQAEARERFARVTVPAPLGANVVAAVLALGRDRELQPLVSKVLAGYKLGGSTRAEADGTFSARAAPLWQEYRERRAAWERDFGDRLDRIFEAHAQSHWLQQWHVTSPNLLAHLHAYLAPLVVARFLLFGHPDLLAFADSADRRSRAAALERVFVEVVSRVTRAVEHNHALVQELRTTLAAGAAEDLDHAGALAIA